RSRTRRATGHSGALGCAPATPQASRMATEALRHARTGVAAVSPECRLGNSQPTGTTLYPRNGGTHRWVSLRRSPSGPLFDDGKTVFRTRQPAEPRNAGGSSRAFRDQNGKGRSDQTKHLRGPWAGDVDPNGDSLRRRSSRQPWLRDLVARPSTVRWVNAYCVVRGQALPSALEHHARVHVV